MFVYGQIRISGFAVSGYQIQKNGAPLRAGRFLDLSVGLPQRRGFTICRARCRIVITLQELGIAVEELRVIRGLLDCLCKGFAGGKRITRLFEFMSPVEGLACRKGKYYG